MGIVDYAVSFVLVGSGLGLAAPVIKEKVPALAQFTNTVKEHPKFVGYFGIIGGALGLLLIPLLLFFTLGSAGMLANLVQLVVAGLYFIGCIFAIVVGVMVLKTFDRETPVEQVSPTQTTIGLAAIGYGIFMLVLHFVGRFLS